MPHLMIAVIVLASAGPKHDAVILSVRGDVEVRSADAKPHTALALGLLYAGDRLVVPPGGEVVLVFIDGSVKERIKPGGEVTIVRSGCTPASSVERLKPARRGVVKGLQGVRPIRGSDRVAASIFRSGQDPASLPSGVRPIEGTATLNDRPALAWKPVPNVSDYLVEVRADGTGNVAWTAKTTEPKLGYPQNEKSLKRGIRYSWWVTDPKGKVLSRSHFSVITFEESKELAEVEALSHSSDPAELLEAALAFEAHGVFEEAL